MPSSVATWTRRASSSHCLRMAVFSALVRSPQAATSAGCLNTLLRLVSAFFFSSLASMVEASVRVPGQRPVTRESSARLLLALAGLAFFLIAGLGSVAFDQAEQIAGQRLPPHPGGPCLPPPSPP